MLDEHTLILMGMVYLIGIPTSALIFGLSLRRNPLSTFAKSYRYHTKILGMDIATSRVLPYLFIFVSAVSWPTVLFGLYLDYKSESLPEETKDSLSSLTPAALVEAPLPKLRKLPTALVGDLAMIMSNSLSRGDCADALRIDHHFGEELIVSTSNVFGEVTVKVGERSFKFKIEEDEKAA